MVEDDAVNQLEFELAWIDGLNQEDLLITLKVSAVSSKSAASQYCGYTTFLLRGLADAMVAHSFKPVEKRSFTLDIDYAYQPFNLTLHEANSNGRVPVELTFHLDEKIVGDYTATVIIWFELGQLESFGKSLASLSKKGVGSICKFESARPAHT